ncbi:glycosyl hydrolase [Fibrobacter succinogenes]|uniref:glycosyl hydrolase n=1 Tax=Fibrobacter succinogenes TaxID=833 RepID=UPI001565BC6F|nr:glycosyl hydrolase [Fibrobacter succinogenes]
MNIFKLLTASAITFTGYSMAEALRYEAEDAIPADDHEIETLTDAKASGGKYVDMGSGNLLFNVDMPKDGYYTLFINYKLPSDRTNKIQNLTLNGNSAGQISFGLTDEFTVIKGAGKIKLSKGKNTIGIEKSWGWVQIDYIEITEFEATPWNISPTPVTPEPTESAQKLYGFLLENFGKRTISGVMTERPFENDGKYTPQDFTTQTELSYINKASGKNVALVGFDFLHTTGKSSEEQWYQGYTHASLEMAKTVWKAGGIPAFNWHWKDPMKEVEAFYTQSSGNTPYTEFSITKAYDSEAKKWKTESDEYKAIVRDMEIVADSLLTLQKEGIALIWRPLHEASGAWFWWGTDGAEPCVALYKLMFDTFVNKKGLHNLIWVWTTDEATDALDWYPGDEYVDIVGRDYYYYPREANHASLISSFEKVKEMYGAKKIVTLSENGSVPYPDSMKADGANWSWFMPWYGDYAMEGWANDNNAESWKTVMNNEYTITLEDMPGWDKYKVEPIAIKPTAPTVAESKVDVSGNIVSFTAAKSGNVSVDVFGMNGKRIATLYNGNIKAGSYSFSLENMPKGRYIVRVKEAEFTATRPILVR